MKKNYKKTLNTLGKNVNLVEWARVCRWSTGQGKDLKTFPVKTPAVMDGRSIWTPEWDEEAGEWQLGFEWDEPRDIKGVIVNYESCEAKNVKLRVDYWNSNWPVPSPERTQGAGRGWIGVDDTRHGKWIAARGETSSTGCIQSLVFDPLDMTEIRSPDRLEWAEDYNVCFRRTLKLRFGFRSSSIPLISSMEITGTAYQEEKFAEIRFGCFCSEERDWSGEISVWNGKLFDIRPLDFDTGDGILSENSWKCTTGGRPKGLRIKYAKYSGSKAGGDRTLISVRTASKSFTFLDEDIEKGSIWIRPHSVLVSIILSDGNWSSEIKKTIQPGRSIYDLISTEPEQSYERASMEIPKLDPVKQAPYGRYAILGWEGVRQEFALRYNGEIFAEKAGLKLAGRDAAKIRWAGNGIHLRFGSGDPPDFRVGNHITAQEIPEPQIPVYISTWEDREIEYTQSSFGALIDGSVAGSGVVKGDEELAAFVRIKIRNTATDAKIAYLWLDLSPSENLTVNGGDVLACGRIIPAETVKQGWKVQNYDEYRLRFHLDTGGKGEIRAQALTEGRYVSSTEKINMEHRMHLGLDNVKIPTSSAIRNTVLYILELPGSGVHQIDLIIPFTTYIGETDIEKIKKLSFNSKLQEVRDYWNNFHNRAAKIELPEKVLKDLIKAVPWHVLVTADRNPETGDYVVPAATYYYGACGNEACMQIRFLDMLGYHEIAERYLDTFIRTQGAGIPDGDFSSASGAFVAVDFDGENIINGDFTYNLDHGFLLACFADHYLLSGNDAWLGKVSQSLIDACEFILRERKTTMMEDEDGSRVRHYGLLPAGHLEDNPEWRYWFAVNAHACGGMIRAVKALSHIGHPEARRLLGECMEYREDVRAAVLKAIVESPVVRISDGSYIPHVPTRTGIRGREYGWIRETAYGPLHLLDGLVFEPDDEIFTWILTDLEDNLFMNREYGRTVDIEKYWFSRGGVTIQANLLNNGPAYLIRDQTSHALRALYNNLCQHLYPDLLVFAEHPVIELGHAVGPFFKTPDESQFLIWLRNLLVREDGESLWICQGAPRRWFEEGEAIVLENLPTAFGNLSCKIESRTREALVKAALVLPNRRTPKTIHLRLRHPGMDCMNEVYINGEPYYNFDRVKDLIILKGFQGKLDIIAKFGN